MKLRSLLLTALLGLGALAPLNTAKADHSCERTRVTYDSHGCPTYWVYTVVDRDCHGRPIYGWVRSSPPARRYDDYRPSYSGGHSSGGYSSGGYSRSSGCDSGRSRSGFYFSFGR
jgi:hypothetical protein